MTTPQLQNLLPSNGSVDIHRAANIAMRIFDVDGVDLTSLVVTITQGASPPETAYDGGSGGFQPGYDGVDSSTSAMATYVDVVIDPVNVLIEAGTVLVGVEVDDSGVPTHLSTSYSFTTSAIDVIQALATDTLLSSVMEHLKGDLAAFDLIDFRFGEGGFQDIGGIRIPKIPDPTKTRLDADGDALTGAVTFANGSPGVTGVGTAFLSEVQNGEYVRLDDDLVWAEVQTVNSDVSITLTGNYTGTGGSGDGSVIVDPLFVFKKTLTGPDVIFGGAGTGRLQVVCNLLAGEANDDGFANPPEFYELGLFDSNGEMLAYGTFPKEEKTGAAAMNKIALIILRRI